MSENDKKEIDSVSGIETTGHEWDGLKELNNPTPRWWLWVFYATCIWSVGYWVVYPAWPTLSGHTKGTAGWTQFTKLETEQAEIDARQAKYGAAFKNASFDQIMKDETLYAFAVAGGKAAFKNNCATCHGSGATGGKGYPNLNDDDWLWGGTLADIYTTLKFGIRAAHDDTRVSQMPAFGRDGVLKQADIKDVAKYVIALSEGKATQDMTGAKIFAENCAACHGDLGQGMREVGAPKLADSIWLYGGDEQSVYQTIYNARAGVMPNWNEKLPDDTLRMLTVYVHSLGGGEADAVPQAAPSVIEGEPNNNDMQQLPENTAAPEPAGAARGE